MGTALLTDRHLWNITFSILRIIIRVEKCYFCMKGSTWDEIEPNLGEIEANIEFFCTSSISAMYMHIGLCGRLG